MTSQSKRRRQRTQQEQSMEVDGDALLSDSHQLLLQYLMHVRMETKQELIRVHEKLFKDRENLSDSISTITSVINPLKMDIKRVVCDVTGATYYVLIHTTGESFFPRCCMFNKTQLEFLKKILTGIVLSTEGLIGKILALNSADNVMTKSEAESTIGQFIKENILMEMNGNALCLSPLAIVEFDPFFNTCFPDNLNSCELCRQLVFVGRVCEGRTCGLKFHNHCVSKWLSSKRSQCPKCEEDWKCDSDADTD